MIVTSSQSLNGPYGMVRAALQRPCGKASDPHPHFCGAGKKVEPQPPSLAQTLELPAGFGVMRTGSWQALSCIKKNASLTLAMTSLSASASPGSSNQEPQGGRLQQQKPTLSRLWSWAAEVNVSAGLVSPAASLLGSPEAVCSLCLHVAFLSQVSVS